MDEIETSILLLVLLGACLVALILVVVARREAAGVRADARADAQAGRAQISEQSKELTRRREHVEAAEQRLHDQSADMEKRLQVIRENADDLAEQRQLLAAQVREHHEQADADIATIAGLTLAQAQARQTDQIVEAAEREATALVYQAESRIRAEADARAKTILATALNRLAVPTSTQNTITLVPLPSQDLKGPLIGKEGRNIRTFEAITGINMIIDENPEHVLLSGFDAERREIARRTLEHLMDSGRINPERIEKAYAQAQTEAGEVAHSSGHQAMLDAGVRGLHPDLVEVLGNLRLRTSYGQSVQAHLIECAQIAGSIAAELGADEKVARRAALLHDIGKALTATQSGTHAALGAALAQKYGETAQVVNAIAAHHEEVGAETVEAVIVQIADSISAARPGARRDDIEKYIERMEALEALVASHDGVTRVLAMASGREVRVLVEPHEVSDAQVSVLAESIAGQIAAEMEVPGEVHVTVVRELRATASTG